MRRRFGWGVLFALTACAGTSVPTAPTQSSHFSAVSSKLHLGGTVYAYADIDGDGERATDFLLTLLRDLPALAPQRGTSRLNATALTRILGLHSVKAVGLSSFEQGELYHNRSFIHHAGPREGLLRVFGGEPASFEVLAIAPKDADLVWEQQIDLGALVDVLRAMGELGVGMSPEELDGALDERVPDFDVTIRELFENKSTKAQLILSVDEARNLWFPGESWTFPYTDFVFRIDGMEALADAIIRRAASDLFIRAEKTEEWIVVRPGFALPPPWNAYRPAVAKEIATGRLYAVSSMEFLQRCLATVEGVTASQEFAGAFDDLPEMGNGLTFLSASMTRQMHAVLDQLVAAHGSSIATTLSRFFLPDAGYPVGWVVRTEPDGILFTSNTASSHKSTLLTLGYAALLPAVAVIGASTLGPKPEDEGFEPPF